MMKHTRPMIVLAAVAITLSGCASQPKNGIEVTRFHLDKAIPPQEINIQPAAGTETKSIEYSQYESAVTEQLAKLGLTRVEGNSAPMYATINISRVLTQEPPKRSPFSIGLGIGSFGSSGGVGGGVSMPVGGSQGGEALVNKLEVQLIRRAENAVSWEGDAQVSSQTDQRANNITVKQITAALFEGFPGDSGKTVTLVPLTDKKDEAGKEEK